MTYYIFAVGKGYHYELIAGGSTLSKTKAYMQRYEKDNPEYKGRMGIFKKVE